MTAVWFILDVAFKFALGVLLGLLAWLPFEAFADASVKPWLVAGTVLGAVLNGFFDGCEVLGLKRRPGIRE